MIEFKTGDILAEDVDALVNSVNCVGVMGRGIAQQFKRAFPDNFSAYEAACKRKEMQPGRMFVFETGQLNPRFIINFPTKRHWRGKSRMEDIDNGLQALVEEVRTRDIRSLAIPALGSGLGGLNWSDVRPKVEEAFRSLNDLHVVVFEPNSALDAKQMVRNRKVPSMTLGRAALINLMYRYFCNLFAPFVTLLEVHKLMYFLQVSQETLRLKYVKAPYGPYAENLHHVLNTVEGHLISGYADGGDDPEKSLELVPGAIEEANLFLEGHAETCRRIDRVIDLVEGFESPFGLELLASVHWGVMNDNIRTMENLVRYTHEWNVRKRKFSKRQIELAVDVLSHKKWIDRLVLDFA